MHAAKGLEFETVFLPGWEEGLFPHQKSLEEKGDLALEEERRLGYVGITRAQKKAYISFAMKRLWHGDWMDSLASRFINELPENGIEKNEEPVKEIVLSKTLNDSFSIPLDENFEKSLRSESFNRFNVSLKDSDIFFRDYRTGPEFLISSDTSNFEMFSLNLDANSSAA